MKCNLNLETNSSLNYLQVEHKLKTPHRRDGSVFLLVGTGRTQSLVPPNLQ